MPATANTQLLIIDPQNDFCDLPEAWCPPDPLQGGVLRPSLPVSGAHQDMLRLAGFIDAARDRLDAITLTLDAHQHLDIAHPGFWQQADGSAVAPFTTITAAQLREGRYRPRETNAEGTVLARCQAYLDALEAAGRYQLMVWPVHCEIGSWGQGVHAAVLAACQRWEEGRQRSVYKLSKGENRWTEHYSALQAEVPDANDARTLLNQPLLEELTQAELLLIAGEASSHCVRASVEHLLAHWPAGQSQRLVLIEDCMSPVTGFEAQQREFFAAMQARGLRLCSSHAALALLAGGR
ncbi:cysteine hydrolase [Paucibacter sp. APW11]|uniref:Cysteine hydrolase n=1 Tax=Roseateles aquae TaxID=3077235 RepID=A0ABU3P7Z4_9BURK|nr:cysteine hydrolase [Paucibacter sp. APW11]MDT8998682.1 cysteine hydrolase [Paucibacter sp. APW11]